MLDKTTFIKSLPANMQKRVDQDLIDKINASITDPDMMDIMRENILGYSQVLSNGRFKILDYVNAVKFVSYRSMGCTKIAAYVKTFPKKYANWKLLGTPDKDIAAYITGYSKTKMVIQIETQSKIPTHILNADIFQEAVNTQAEIMRDPNVSPKVRSDACNSIMTHLKSPEAAQVELNIGVKDDSKIAALKELTANLAAELKQSIDVGLNTAKDVAHQPIVLEHDEDAN